MKLRSEPKLPKYNATCEYRHVVSDFGDTSLTSIINNCYDELTVHGYTKEEIDNYDLLNNTKIESEYSYYDSQEVIAIMHNVPLSSKRRDELQKSYLKKKKEYDAWYKENEKDIIAYQQEKKKKATIIAENNLQKQIVETQKLLEKLKKTKTKFTISKPKP